ILEGSYTNVLYMEDSTLFYVDRCNNYLHGIMQDKVLETAEKIDGIKIESLMKGIPLVRIKEADEVMVCNSLMTVQNVRKIIRGDEVFTWGSSPSSDYLASVLRKELVH
ncbi:MAG: aminotransferase class IV, partial [Spirochaetaceae bacterium]|nr:aminotransferase class IV [Spirochaetaceae bacterium]